jgi:hypothetical protein
VVGAVVLSWLRVLVDAGLTAEYWHATHGANDKSRENLVRALAVDTAAHHHRRHDCPTRYRIRLDSEVFFVSIPTSGGEELEAGMNGCGRRTRGNSDSSIENKLLPQEQSRLARCRGNPG